MKLLSSLMAGFLLTAPIQGNASPVDDLHGYFKTPVIAGNGCPIGSVSVTGINTATLNIVFDSYDAGKHALSGLSRAGCSFSIPIRVPSGYEISNITTEWQGFIEGKGQLKRKYFVLGEPYMPWKTNNYDIPSGDRFLVTDDFYHSSFKMGCNGGVKILRINSQIKAMKKNSYIAVASNDLTNRLIFNVQFSPC